MPIDVSDTTLNIALNACFIAIILLTVISIIPWAIFGAKNISRILRWLFFPVLMLAITYEVIMPSRFDIRFDLLFLLPMYGIVLVTCAFRWLIHIRSK